MAFLFNSARSAPMKAMISISVWLASAERVYFFQWVIGAFRTLERLETGNFGSRGSLSRASKSDLIGFDRSSMSSSVS